MMNQWETIIDERLVDVYGVDKATLETNRRGKLTDAQIARLRKLRWPRIAKHSAWFVLSLVAWYLLGTVSANGIFAFLLGFIRLVLILVVLLEAWRVLYFYWYTTQEIARGEVKMYPGRLQKIVWNKIRIMYCERGEFYGLPNREWNAFDHYKRYRVFCTPRTKIIVAAQPVHRDEPLPEAWA